MRGTSSTSAGEDGAPFGLPVLQEVPELAAALDQLVAADRAVAVALDHLVRLTASHVAETATGVGLDGWLTIVARRTRSDRRMLRLVVEMCRRLPRVHACFREGLLSWGQMRAVALEARAVPKEHDAVLDEELTTTIVELVGSDPDDLRRAVRWTVIELLPSLPLEAAPQEPPEQDRLVLQPRLDGSGGTLFGDFGPESFAVLEAATEPGPPAALPGTEATPDGHDDAEDDGDDEDDEARRFRTRRRQMAAARAARLVAACRGGDAVGSARPQVLLRTELSTLLDATGGRPGQLLTHLTGGAMWVDAPTARRLADAEVDLRLIVTDGGRPLGVGLSRRTPPRWLRDAALALHDTCTEPGCLTAARVCDLDHGQPWSRGGATDVDNLAPVCPGGNHAKEAAGWRAAQRGDGSRRWWHPRSGLAITTMPAVWDGVRPAGRADAASRPPAPGGGRRAWASQRIRYPTPVPWARTTPPRGVVAAIETRWPPGARPWDRLPRSAPADDEPWPF